MEFRLCLIQVCALTLLFLYRVNAQNTFSDVRLTLRGIDYPNNSIIIMSGIGTDTSNPSLEALQCVTDYRPCCRNPSFRGEWYNPEGTQILGISRPGNFFRTRGYEDGTINLFRRNTEITSPIGSFCCEIPDISDTNQTLCANIVPQGFSIVINDESTTPTLEHSYSLTCIVSGGRVDTYLWRKDGVELSGQTAETLNFPSLELSDAAQYTCEVSGTIASDTFTVIRQSQDVLIQIPAPTSVRVTSDQANPLAIRPIGSATVTLTCTVELKPISDVPATLITVWTGPSGFLLNQTQPVMGNVNSYTSTAMVNSFGRDQSGNYTCTATVSSPIQSIITSMQTASSVRVTVGVYLTLYGEFTPNNSAIPIEELDDVHVSGYSIQCITDRLPCCATLPYRAGEWYFPGDGGVVPTLGSGADVTTTFYRNRGDDGTVNLHRFSSDVMMPTGRYCCVVPDATGVMQWACVVITPRPTVHLFSPLTNPIISGSPLTLTCTMEFHQSVDTPVTVNTVWTGPDGSPITVATNPAMMETLTLYRSTITTEVKESGVYSCTMNVGSSGIAATNNVEVVDGKFQLRLKGVDICSQWYTEYQYHRSVTEYSRFIKEAVTEAVQRHCKCHFLISNLLDDSFSCEESVNLLTYRGTLLGTHNFNGSQIVKFIQDWASGGPRITIGTDGRNVRIDRSCPVDISAVDDPECG